jgi:hypothetical protein
MLTARQQRAIQALLTERTVTDAAKAAKVSRRTLTSWLADEQFCAVLSKATGEAIDATVRRLAALSGSATSVLADAMCTDEKTPVRVRAADIVLSRLMSLREQFELEQRIAALEEKAKHEQP